MKGPKAALVTQAEYLEYDRTHEGRHEIVNGEIIAMAAASPEHGALVSNAHFLLRLALRDRCRAYVADLRVAIDETGLYAYPDIVIACGEQEFAPTTPETLLNPTVLVEVLSDSTAGSDRGEKLEHYRHRASVQAVVLIDSCAQAITVVSRNPDATWTITDAVSGMIRVPGIDVVLDVAEVYEGVRFGAAPHPAPGAVAAS